MTDGKAEAELRRATREAQAVVRQRTDALWGEAFAGRIAWEEAQRRLRVALGAFEGALGVAAEPLAVDAVGGSDESAAG